MDRKPFLIALAELIVTYWPRTNPRQRGWLRTLLPTPGNAIFTLLVIAALVWAQSAGALPLRSTQHATASTGTIAYQGRLADASGAPLTGTYNMIFRLYDVATGGTPLWTEQWTGSNSVRVSDGLFNVMLGSLNRIEQNMIAGHDQLWLGITVGTDDEMAPRVQLGSVPFAVQALTVPDGSITPEKLDRQYVNKNGDTIGWGGLTVLGEITAGRITAGGEGGGLHLTINDIPGAKWKLGTGGYDLTLYNDFDAPGTFAEKVRFTEVGDLQMNGHSLTQVGNIFGHGQNAAQIHMPATGNGNLYINWHSGGELHFGGGKEQDLFSVDTMGNLWARGELRANGAKPAIVDTNTFGQRKLYAAESPEVRFFDEGLAHLQNGGARVELDPVFLETIEGEYLVHVTPYGDAGLYVAEIGRDYFVVKARAGDPDVAFAWRLSATRKGYVGVRLEQIGQ